MTATTAATDECDPTRVACPACLTTERFCALSGFCRTMALEVAIRFTLLGGPPILDMLIFRRMTCLAKPPIVCVYVSTFFAGVCDHQ